MKIDAETLALLPDDAQIMVQTTAGDLRRAMETRQGGAEELSTQEAARYIGRNSKWWRQHAPKVRDFWEGLPATHPAKARWREEHPRDPRGGAYTDQSGRWRLLNLAARAYYASLYGGGEDRPTSDRRVRRGPRKQTEARGR